MKDERHRPIRSSVVAVICTAWACPPAVAQPPDRMTFKNNLLPGHLTRHKITRVVTRMAQRGKHVEKLKYKQEADWLQCNIDEPAPGRVTVYQMMVDQPAKILSVSRDKKKIKPTPPASAYNLAGPSTRLHSAFKTPRDGPVQAPLCDPVEQTVLQALLDFPHWPDRTLDAGDRWERDIEFPGFKGVQTFEFVDLVRIGQEVGARLTMSISGEFTDVLKRDYLFGGARATIYWSRLERTLMKMEAQAEYQRKREQAPDEYALRLDAVIAQMGSLDSDQQELIKQQIAIFAEALKIHRQGHLSDAKALCRQFRAKWPDSMWLPAVHELESRCTMSPETDQRYSPREIKDILVKSVIAYEAARASGEYDLLDKTRLALQQLVENYRVRLNKLAKDEDDGVRGRAAFALAFGSRPEDLRAAQKAVRDAAPRVREMALSGLAARGSPDTSVELLLSSLDDRNARVRRRACQAVAACVPPEHYSVVKLIEKLDHLMVFDESDAVRLEAIRAIAAIGVPADVAKLEKALTHELDHENREALFEAIEALRKKDG